MDPSASGLSESQGLIQSLKDEIESIKRPSGTQTNPARSCKDLHMCRGDLKDGRLFWWLHIVVFDKWTTMCNCYPALLRLFKVSFVSGLALIRGRLWFGFDNPWRNFASSSLFVFSVLQGNGKGFIFWAPWRKQEKGESLKILLNYYGSWGIIVRETTPWIGP